ncbi:MAG: ATP-binding protein [Chloroflexota bacterium]|nr:ATP-binding protein [Chloroflexota bacterium]
MAERTNINYRYFFQKLLEAMPWPVLVIDRALSIQYYNQQVAPLFGTSQLLWQMNLEQLVPDPAIIQLVRESIQTDSPRYGEHDNEARGPTWKISVTPLEHRPFANSREGEPEQGALMEQPLPPYRYFAVAIEDLSELRRLERVRRDFIANVSHELRTPLASIRLLTETLEDAIDTDPDKAQTFVEKIEVEVHYLSGLVADLLELSRIESGQLPMAIEPMEAEQLVWEAMARLLSQAQRHRVKLGTEIHDGRTRVAADSRQIGRVLVNLLHNAIKFTPSGGEVILGTMLLSDGKTQRFFVRDTGVGIPAEDLPRIFERFYKVDRARSKVDYIGGGGRGSGLGLAIARHVVEAHGGRITAESNIEQGSTFAFTLPVAAQTAPTAQ